MKNCFRAILSILLISALNQARAEVAVVVSNNADTAPSQTQIANIFLGRDRTYTPIDQKDWSSTKETFYLAVTNKNEAQLKSYWSGLVFTGKGQPPTTVADDASVVAKVAQDPTLIGYVDSSATNESVKVIFTIP